MPDLQEMLDELNASTQSQDDIDSFLAELNAPSYQPPSEYAAMLAEWNNGAAGQSRYDSMLAEWNQPSYQPPRLGQQVTILVGDEKRPIEESLYPKLPGLARSAIAGAAAVGAAIENPVLRVFGYGDEADKNRRAVEGLRAYNRELNKDSILGQTVGPLVGDVADSLAAGTLSAPAGGLAAVATTFGVDGADRTYVQSRDSGLPDDVAAKAAARQFLIDGALTYAGGKFVQSKGFNPGRYFGASTGQAVNRVAESSGLKQALGSALLDSGVEGIQGGLTYLNESFTGLHDFDLTEFATATGMSALAGGLAGGVTSGVQSIETAYQKFQADLPKAMAGLSAANTFAASATPQQKLAAIQADSAAKFAEVTGEQKTSPAYRDSFRDELQALVELEAELAQKGVEVGQSLDAETQSLQARREKLAADSFELASIEKSLAETARDATALPEGYAKRKAEATQMREAIEAEQSAVAEAEQRVERRKRASEGEIGEQRAFLESELDRIAAREKAEGNQEGTPEAAAPVVRVRPPKRIEQRFDELELSRMSVDDVRLRAGRGETLDNASRRDLAKLIDKQVSNVASRVALSRDLALADTPAKLDKVLGRLEKALAVTETGLARNDFDDAVRKARNLRPEFADEVEAARQSVNRYSAESMREAAEMIRTAAYQSEMADRFLTMNTAQAISDTSAQVVNEIDKARSLSMKGNDPLRAAMGQDTPGLEVSRDALSLDSPFFREMAARPEVQLRRLSDTLAEAVWERLGVQSQAQYDLNGKELLTGLSGLMNQLGLDHAPTLDSTVGAIARRVLARNPQAAAQVPGHTLEAWRTEYQEIEGVRLSRDEALGLFYLGMDPRNAKVLEEHGFQLPDGRRFEKVGERVNNQLVDFIGDEGLELADWAFRYGNGPLIDRVNDAWRMVTGRPLTRRRDVVPRVVDRTAELTGAPGDSLRAMRDATLTSYSHLKHRTETGQPLTWMDGTTGFFDYFLNHADKMNRVAAFLPATRDAHAILNRPEVEQAILAKDGKQGLENIREAIRIQTVGSRRVNTTEAAVRRWNAINAAGILGARLTTTLMQGMSTIASSAWRPGMVRDFVRALPEIASQETLQRMEQTLGQHSGHYWKRYEDQAFAGEQTGGVYQNRGWFRPPQMAQHALRPLQETERVLNSVIRFAQAEMYAQQSGLTPDSPEWGPFVAREWERATYRGENTSHGMELSGALRLGRDNPMFGTVVTFQSTASKIYSLLPRATDLMDQGRYREAIGVLGVLVAAQLPVTLLREAMTLSEQKDDPFVEAASKRSVRDLVGLHPLGNAIVTPMVIALQGMRQSRNEPALVSSMMDVGLASADFAEAVIDQAERSPNQKTAAESLYKAIVSGGTMFGLPFKGLDDFRQRLERGTLFPGLDRGPDELSLQETIDRLSF